MNCLPPIFNFYNNIPEKYFLVATWLILNYVTCSLQLIFQIKNIF